MRQGHLNSAKMREQGFGWLKSLALLPLPLFIVLIIVFTYTDPGTVFEPPYILTALNGLFTTIIPCAIAYLAWRGFTNNGQASLFFIGCGVVALGCGSLVAGFIINVPGGVNLSVAVYNTGALLAAILICISAIFSLQKAPLYTLERHRAFYLGLCYLAAIIFMSLFAIAVYESLVPPFFVQGTGATILRQVVLGTATVLFAVSSVIFMRVSIRSASDFTYWLSLAMTLITIGLCAIFLQRSVGSPVGWTGRVAQYLGCVYMLIGIVAAYRMSNIKRIPLENEIARSFSYIEANYKTLVEMAPNAVISCDKQSRILSWNPAAAKIFGYTEPEAIGANVIDFIFPRESALLINSELQELARAKGQPAEFSNKIETMARRKQGEDFPVEVYMAMKKVSGEWLGTFIIRDITESKRVENELQKLASVVHFSSEIVNLATLDGKMIFLNQAGAKMLGIDPQKVDQFNITQVIPDHLQEKVQTELLPALLKGGTWEGDLQYLNLKTGLLTDVHAMTFAIKDPLTGAPLYFANVSLDITVRKKTEESILRSKMLLQSVIDSTPDWMYVKDLQHKFLLVNRSFAEAQNINPQDMISRADTDFFSEELCLGNPDKGIRGFHTDDTQAFHGQIVHNPRNMVTWADGSLHMYDTYKIPLRDQTGNVYGALVYSRDITEQQEAEYEREAAFSTLQKTLHDVINTMAKIVEMRDPYTSGHQGRVAGLAGAIARDMKLNDSRVEHLMMAASIHDVGKMYVPADILSKPGKLSEIEWEMIKTHVQGSYEILKDLEFSQPIALMVLQHHERLDGSGYPNGLKGDEMLIESRILAVADVVEAMSSHRPYRPALGIDKALEEISGNKGKLYDPDVVDFCVKLFREQGFKFEG